MIRIDPPGRCLPSEIATLEAAARAAEAAQLRADVEAEAAFMNARVRWFGWTDTEQALHETVSLSFDFEDMSARIMADLDAAHNASMDAYIQNMIGGIGNWRPTGLFQPCSTGTEAGQQA
jgi:hypothetical protein